MKLNPDYILQQVGEEGFLVPVGAAAERFHGMLRMNGTAFFILERLKEDTTPAALVAALAEEYEGTAEQFAQSVEHTLSKLREAGALME